MKAIGPETAGRIGIFRTAPARISPDFSADYLEAPLATVLATHEAHLWFATA
jgi:hypothetical protein